MSQTSSKRPPSSLDKRLTAMATLGGMKAAWFRAKIRGCRHSAIRHGVPMLIARQVVDLARYVGLLQGNLITITKNARMYPSGGWGVVILPYKARQSHVVPML